MPCSTELFSAVLTHYTDTSNSFSKSEPPSRPGKWLISSEPERSLHLLHLEFPTRLPLQIPSSQAEVKYTDTGQLRLALSSRWIQMSVKDEVAIKEMNQELKYVSGHHSVPDVRGNRWVPRG